jgi:hypothetical protein
MKSEKLDGSFFNDGMGGGSFKFERDFLPLGTF